MKNHEMKKIIVISIAVILSLACLSTQAGSLALAPADSVNMQVIVYTSTPQTKPMPTRTAFLVCVVTADEALNLRAGPGTGYTILAWLTPGQVLTVYDRSGDAWLLVGVDGKTGYIHRDYCR